VPSFSRKLELTLHRALVCANKRDHEYATLEYLLLAPIDDRDTAAVTKTRKANLGALLQMAGFDIEPNVLQGAPIRNAIDGWFISAALAFAAAMLLFKIRFAAGPTLTALSPSTELIRRTRRPRQVSLGLSTPGQTKPGRTTPRGRAIISHRFALTTPWRSRRNAKIFRRGYK